MPNAPLIGDLWRRYRIQEKQVIGDQPSVISDARYRKAGDQVISSR